MDMASKLIYIYIYIYCGLRILESCQHVSLETTAIPTSSVSAPSLFLVWCTGCFKIHLQTRAGVLVWQS